MMNNLFNDDLCANNGDSIPPSEVSWDSMTSALILNADKDGAFDSWDRRTSELSFFQQATDQTMLSTMTATNPADPYNPNFVYALMMTLSNNSRTIALLHNTKDCLKNTLLVMIITQEQEIAIFSASNHFLANEVYAYLQDSSQQDEVELTHLY